ncbi:MAG TPA: protein translocase subunit SecD [Elusimicrobia bacterium]|nr:protein translocase subunit SecD [Elusimicrobiota bacterium]
MSKLQLKWAGVLALVLAACALLYPTFNWYSMTAQERDRLEASRLRPKWLLNLGLDLRGGTHLVMELDVSKLPQDADVKDAVDRAIEIIRNRVDQFGVAEPLIARQGERWIVVQLPGITNTVQAKEIIGKTALLEFRMEDDSEKAREARQKIAELGDPFEKDPDGIMRATQGALALVPPGDELFPGKESTFYLVRATAPLNGSQLDGASVSNGSNGMPIVNFKFKPAGGKIFGELTTANVGKNMAIILDNLVYSAPVIKSPIRGGSGIIEGNFRMEEARNLAIVLRAGALPAPVRIIEERTVGASLGEDSIRQGLKACLIGGVLIVLFMLVYYQLGGVFANLALLLNLLFLLALMSYFGSTLTLPGIAGILLTAGMAVDANVLIFERIREELRAGKPVRIAVDAGYDRAFSAILDSNVTTLISAMFLFQFGTGPIKGFAVTLTIGILASMFTAIIVTHMMFHAYLANRSVDKLHIG